jgi:hypothetical protein
MARLNRKTELFDRLTKVEVIREATGTHGNSTLTAAVAAGGTTLSLTAATNFADADVLLIDTGEFLEINKQSGAPATNDVTASFGLLYAHDVGTVVKEGVAIDLGHVEAGGFQFQSGGQFNAINSAIRRLTLAYSAGYTEMSGTLGLIGFNPENFALAMGIPETNVIGTGTSSDPYTLLLGADNLDTAGDQAVRLTGARKDGGIVQLELWGVQFDFSTVQVQWTRGQVAQIPLGIKVTSGALLRQWN